MEAKGTVMNETSIQVWCLEFVQPGELDLNAKLKEFAQAQAEISFKAGMKHGIWLFAWWKDGVQYVGTSGRTLEKAYKELGIIETKGDKS